MLSHWKYYSSNYSKSDFEVEWDLAIAWNKMDLFWEIKWYYHETQIWNLNADENK